jgi:hypothetical protein
MNKIQDAQTETAANEIKNVCKKKYQWTFVPQQSNVDFNHPFNQVGSFVDVNLGEHFDSVTYKKGKGVENEKNKGWWWYENENLQIGLNKDNRVKVIVISCLNTKSEISLHGVSCGSSEDDLIHRYKGKGKIICHENSPEVRTFIVQEFGIYFSMKKNHVTSLILASDPPSGIECQN